MKGLSNARTAADFSPVLLSKRCPFCGKPWSYDGYCGDRPLGAPGNWHEQNAAGIFFPGRRSRLSTIVKECVVCRGVFTTTSRTALYCNGPCARRAEMERVRLDPERLAAQQAAQHAAYLRRRAHP